MRPDHLPLITSVSAPTVHPRDRWAVVATSRPDFDADAYVGQLWRVPLDGDAPRRLTRGFSDSSPKFSPDGRLIAFIRSTPDGKPQLFLMPADGGEPMQVTDRKLGVSDVVFSPDSRHLAFVSRVPEEGRYGTLDGVSPGQEDARHLTTFQFQMNGLGYTADKRSHVFVMDVPDVFAEPAVKPVGRAAKALADARATLGESAEDAEQDTGLFPQATQLTEGDADHTQPVFAADGRSVIVVARRHETADTDLVSDLYRFALDGGDPVRLTNPGGGSRLGVDGPAVSEDGELLFFIGEDMGASGRDFVGRNPGLFVMPASGGEATRLTDAETIAITSRPVLDGLDGVLVVEEVRGDARVLRVLADGTSEVVLEGSLVTQAVEPVPGTDEVVVTFADHHTAGDVALVSPDGILDRLTDFSASLRDQAKVLNPIEIEATAPDDYPVHGWVVLPEGEGPHPVLLVIHGGPFAAYHGSWFDEFQVYASAGYAVVACNPRGSFGYGQAHGRVIKGDMGNLDMVDILAFLDHAIATVPGLDGERVGVMGGSYGGYMTAWLIGHDHRWQGAIVERGYLDPASFIGSSDIGWFFSSEYTGEGLEAANRQSPMMFTGEVTTPTLVLHSEQDLRCPLSQALRYYTEIKLNGADAELLIFPGENHELSRSGTPHHRRQRFEKVLDWWSRKLPVHV